MHRWGEVLYEKIRQARQEQQRSGREPAGRHRTSPCGAIADGITFHCTLMQTGTEPYRLQATETTHHGKTHR
ncbi:hypothetical protein ACIRU3_45545 [Streptomyces sp. NPDC101151]|uniref:hypothetical protein n=1 Tax=Streptomyces sp. NPDC101151 TaxID=3366115 RepID=UPI003824A9D7